jgi:hypothetical protein
MEGDPAGDEKEQGIGMASPHLFQSGVSIDIGPTSDLSG